MIRQTLSASKSEPERMLQFLHCENIWQILKTISRQRDCPLFVAVPYLGNHAGKLLTFKRGDVLLVDLTLQNSANGSVCLAEIERLQKNGVEVFLAPHLHAKIVLCGRKAVVSSANLSQTSFDDLDEAGLLTTDAKVIKQIGDWFQERMGQRLGPEFLRECAEAYKPPKAGIGGMGKGSPGRAAHRVWLLNVQLLEQFPDDEDAVAQLGRSRAESELSDSKKFEVFPIRWPGREQFLDRIRKGDTVIQIIKQTASPYIEEAAQLIGITKTESRRGVPVTYFYLECRRSPKRFPWGVFKRYCTSVRLGLSRGIQARELRQPIQQKVLAFLARKQKQTTGAKR
jgi:hypothetical protein